MAIPFYLQAEQGFLVDEGMDALLDELTGLVAFLARGSKADLRVFADGEDLRCRPDPVAIAPELAARGCDVQV